MKQNKNRLSQSAKEKLGYYVYLLIDPRNQKPFYVGKGISNRIYHHGISALKSKAAEKEKTKRIIAIKNAGRKVGLEILRHGLTSQEAFEVESSAIDLIGKGILTNIQGGHDSNDRGKMSVKEVELKYKAKKASFEKPVILININKHYERGMTPEQVYEVTRKHWRINHKKANKIDVVCGVCRGIIRGVFLSSGWERSVDAPKEKDRKRFHFVGKIASDSLCKRYFETNVDGYWSRGAQYPIKYVGKSSREK